jgi:hypothetical protein
MFGRAPFVGFLLSALLAAAPPCKRKTEVYSSPDGALQAIVVTEATCEAWFDFQTTSPKRILASRDERSEDGEHGRFLVKAAWTSDSQFFIASLQSTGGHQPWAYPLSIYSRSKNRVFELSKFGATAIDVFTLKAGDIIKVPILGCSGLETKPDGTVVNQPTLVFDPHRFVSSGRLPVPQCPGR